ncbi:hypothetical protein [Ramlibacter sp. Leaf400]|uniref:hypothetical protein n=1 Tax=Ramlibacter sp. Leaf400 TaxID=1736365 RepID=UPI001F19C96C|nr:hypothetical protein [Ramlibacter sp. Leaf400]
MMDKLLRGKFVPLPHFPSLHGGTEIIAIDRERSGPAIVSLDERFHEFRPATPNLAPSIPTGKAA